MARATIQNWIRDFREKTVEVPLANNLNKKSATLGKASRIMMMSVIQMHIEVLEAFQKEFEMWDSLE